MRVLSVLSLALVTTAASAQIGIPDYVRTYRSPTHVRGFYFRVQGLMVVAGVQVPDEMKEGRQYVALYKLKAPPPPYPASVDGTPVFFGTGSPSQELVVTPAVIYQKGDWLMVLGCCAGTTGYVQNSYGVANYKSKVLGLPVMLVRGGTQEHMVALKGKVKLWSEASDPISRVRVFVNGHGSAKRYDQATGTPAPQLLASDPMPPSIGETAAMKIVPGTANNLLGILLQGYGRGKLPVAPFGTLLVNLPLAVVLPLPGPIPSAGTTLKLPLPNNNALLGHLTRWQVLMILSRTTFSMTNGLEWNIGR